MSNFCPVCDLAGVISHNSTPTKTDYQCSRCGIFSLSFEANILLRENKEKEPLLGPALSHNIRKNQRSFENPYISSDIVEKLAEDPVLPSPNEQAENFLLWLADTTKTPGNMVKVNSMEISGAIGARDANNVEFIIKSLLERGLVEGDREPGGAFIELSFGGWEYVDQLKRMSNEGTKAFMAMAFGNSDLEEIVENNFKPAVRATGFGLFRLDDRPEAGSIDERLRVEIRRSAVLIADLSDANRGAYWEAGFAEGLGKPVIYTCEEKFFKEKGTHFDTSHLHTVLWKKEDPGKAEAELKATIRATLPHLAKMDDS